MKNFTFILKFILLTGVMACFSNGVSAMNDSPDDDLHTEGLITGTVHLSPTTLPDNIPDNGNKSYSLLISDDIPDNAIVTRVTYHFIIDDIGGSASFRCDDYEIYLDNLTNGGTGTYLCVYDNLGDGAGTDGNEDDDSGAADSDIHVEARTTHAFDGEAVKTIWVMNFVDNSPTYTGQVIECALSIHWEAMLPNLDVTQTPSGWDSPLIVSDQEDTHSDASRLNILQNNYIDCSFILEDADISEDFWIALYVDETNIFKHKYEGASVDEYLWEDIAYATLERGEKEVCVTIDKYNENITEDNEDDNEYCKTLTWKYPLPPAPGLIEPANEATCTEEDITFSWTTTDYTFDVYGLQVATESEFENFAYNGGGSVDEILVTDLEPGTTYYWRVRGGNLDGYGDWSSTRTFTTAGPSAVPSLSSPAADATCQSLNPTLSWNSVSGANSYDIRVDDNSDFSSTIVLEENVDGTSINLSELATQTLYYWQVKSNNACGLSSDWSAARSFVTGNGGIDMPTPTSPANSSSDLSGTISLSWESVDGADSYLVQVDDNNDFSSTLYSEELSSTSAEISGLNEGTTYYWHVQAIGDCSSSDWCAAWSFTTASTSGPNALSVNITDQSYSLGQNYPNPFSEVTNIDFTLPSSEFVIIELIDLQGKTVLSHKAYYTAGTHTYQLENDDALDSGLYLYRMKTSSFTTTKRCIVY